MPVYPSTLLLPGFAVKLLSLQHLFYFSIYNFMLDWIYIVLSEWTLSFLFLIFLSKCSWSPEGQSQCACKALEEKQSWAKEMLLQRALKSLWEWKLLHLIGTTKGELLCSCFSESWHTLVFPCTSSHKWSCLVCIFNCWSRTKLPSDLGGSPAG